MNTHVSTHVAAFIALITLVSLTWVTAAYAASRDSVRGSGGTPTPVATTVPHTSQLPGFPGASGGISNTTTGVVQSGGNTGGNVTTGDENVTVHVVNSGPTNNNTTVIASSDSETPSIPQCTDRRTGRCPTEGSGRSR